MCFIIDKKIMVWCGTWVFSILFLLFAAAPVLNPVGLGFDIVKMVFLGFQCKTWVSMYNLGFDV
jgi:hypothetical protein